MARIRSIHYDALKSEKLAAVSAEAERCYWRLATHCDDEGRAEDNPRLFASYLFPLHDDVDGAKVDGWIGELAEAHLLERYEVDGRRFLVVARWKDYQKPNRPTLSKIPPPPEPLTEDSLSSQGGLITGGEGSGEGEGVLLAPVARPRDVIFDALVEVCALDAGQLTSSSRGALNRARKELAGLGASDEDVRRKAEAYRVQYPSASLTPSALVKHWPALGAVRPQPAPIPGPARAVLGRGPDAPKVWTLDEAGNAVAAGGAA